MVVVMPPINLADPAFEPTDQQLVDLSKRAFADVGTQHRDSLAKLRSEIATLRAGVRRRLTIGK